MKRIIILMAFSGLLLLTFSISAQHILSLGQDQSSPKASIEDVAWIAEHWQGEAMGGITEEIWSPPLGNSMMGMFRLIKFNKVSFYELETITEEDESLVLKLKHFHGDLKGWEEKDETVDFPLVKLEKNKAYFDGMTFDRVSNNELNIYVLVGNEVGKAKEMKFSFRLVE